MDDCDFNKLKQLLKNRKVTNYLSQSVVNKNLAKQVIGDFKKFKTPKYLKTLRDKHFAHITQRTSSGKVSPLEQLKNIEIKSQVLSPYAS